MRYSVLALSLSLAACATAPVSEREGGKQGDSPNNPLPSPFEPPAEVDPPPKPLPGEEPPGEV